MGIAGVLVEVKELAGVGLRLERLSLPRLLHSKSKYGLWTKLHFVRRCLGLSLRYRGNHLVPEYSHQKN